MPLSSEVKQLAVQALKIRKSQVPLHRVMDILATQDGDISTVLNRFRDIDDAELRRAFHHCAKLLRAIEAEAGLTPAWEQPQSPGQTSAVSSSAPSSSSVAAPASPAKEKVSKQKFRPEELLDFEDDVARGQVRSAKIYVDGASKGNPGDAGIGAALFAMDGRKIAQLSRAIGTATNNIAEYTALIEGMRMAQRMGVRSLAVISDSELMVKQIGGQYKIKNPDILKKAQEAQALRKQFDGFTISYVGRDHNQLADALSTCRLKKSSEKAAAPGDNVYRDVLGQLDETLDDGSTE